MAASSSHTTIAHEPALSPCRLPKRGCPELLAHLILALRNYSTGASVSHRNKRVVLAKSRPRFVCNRA
jgi:hypothetical protein